MVSEHASTRENLVAGVGAGESEQGGHGEFAAVVSQPEPLVAHQPGDGPLDHPAHPAETVLALHPTAGDAGGDAAPTQVRAAAREVVALVGVQLGRAAARAATAAALDRRGRVEQRLEPLAVVGVRCGQQRGQWHPVRVDQDVVLRSRLAPIGGVGAGQTAPLFARTLTRPSRPGTSPAAPAPRDGRAPLGATAPTLRPAATPAAAANRSPLTRSPSRSAAPASGTRSSPQTESPPAHAGPTHAGAHPVPAPVAARGPAVR